MKIHSATTNPVACVFVIMKIVHLVLPACLILVSSAVFGRDAVKPDYLTLGFGVNEVLDSHGRYFGSAELTFTPVVSELHPWLFASLSEEEACFLAAGLAWRFEAKNHPWSAAVGIGPGYYRQGNDAYLGGDFEIMSFVEIAYRLNNDALLGLRFAHLSNGSTAARNPGTELLSLQYSIPLGHRMASAK